MTNKDKVIAAFLASVGVFSAAQASQYVGTLTTKEKHTLSIVAKAPKSNVLLCNSVTDLSGTENGTKKTS